MTQRSILLVKHIDFETGGHATRLVSHLPTSEVVFPEDVPPLDEIAGVVLFGGEMAATDVREHPSLGVTTDLARRAVEAEIPVLGLCLGHQILGVALGARLTAGAVDEVGLTPVEVIEPDPWLGGFTGTLRPMQWHTDVVSLPTGATLVARNDAVENQGFRYGSAFGAQFHLEVDERVLRLWDTCTTPPLHAALPDGDMAALQADYRADATLHTVAERGFSAFAEACRARL